MAQVPSDIPPAQWALALLPQVFKALPSDGVRVFAVDPQLSDTQACSDAYGIAMDDCANTLVLKAKIAGAERLVAAVILGTRRLDANGLVRTALNAQKVSFAAQEVALSLSGMEAGGITAFGLPPDWLVLVDAAVMQRERIVMGAGRRDTKLDLPPQALLGLAHVVVAEVSLPR